MAKENTMLIKIGSLWKTTKNPKVKATGEMIDGAKVMVMMRNKKKLSEPDFDIVATKLTKAKEKPITEEKIEEW